MVAHPEPAAQAQPPGTRCLGGTPLKADTTPQQSRAGRADTHRRRRLLTVAAAAVGAVVVILFGLAWRASTDIMYPGPPHYAWTLADYPALAAVVEPLRVRSSTGVTLVGRFFPGRYDATIVLSHGYGGDEDEMLPVANTLHAAGFTVVTYNERGQDGSGGTATKGPLEATDLRSVIDTVVHHPHVDRNAIGAFGFSLGSDITVLEAAGDPRVKAVVVDASAPYLTAYAQARLSDILLHPTALWTPLSIWLLELRTGADLAQNRAAAVVARISPRPILFIQGLADTEVKPWETIDTYRHARAPRELWLVKGEGHEATVAPGGAASSPRVAAFFARALLPARDRARSSGAAIRDPQRSSLASSAANGS